MKIELRKPTWYFEGRIDDYLELYITKNQLIKSFETDKNQCYEEFSMCLEMYTAPCCFRNNLDFNYVKELYNKIKSKSSYKGIVFNIKETYDYSINKLGTPKRNLVCAII